MRQFIVPLALAQKGVGYSVICACTPGPHWEELEATGLRMLPVGIRRSANPIRAVGSIIEVAVMLRDLRPDVLHVHTPIASMIGRIAGRWAGVKTIVYTAHGFYFHDRMPSLRRHLHIALEKFFGWMTSYLFCVSGEDRDSAVRLGIKSADKVFYVGNGADPQKFNVALREKRKETRAALRIPQEAVVIAIVGRLVREKGYLEFFASARTLADKFPHVHFLAIGDIVTSEHDNAKDDIVLAAEQVALGHVHFMGMRDDVPKLLAASDIFCLPSHREGLPVSLIEAMMMGLPSVATNIRGCRELIRDGVDGILVESKNTTQLTDALARLVEDSQLRTSLGESARARALADFDESRILERELKIYEQILP